MYNMISFSFNQKPHLSHLFYILVVLSSKPLTYIHISPNSRSHRAIDALFKTKLEGYSTTLDITNRMNSW
ncbi:hypothetical protein Hanom_Chr04g00316441 [Helianthus anomalus]